ncbi:hypothetical protein [Parasitella parasitica]|uniref:Ty3 transposon capsid-like protein domain-containing protein n=1 Tax=Parasitella parasitica TaxID=35722 RepID=A0A0B7NR97_9FUNG|nr:hypothetical protein [Parasitella parasitica]
MASNQLHIHALQKKIVGKSGTKNLTEEEITQLSQNLSNVSLKDDNVIREPKVNDPRTFTGINHNGDGYNRLENFLTQLNIVFKLNPSRFHDDETKIIYAASFMDATAFEWIQPYINSIGTPAQDPLVTNYQQFTIAIRKMFGDVTLVSEAESKVMKLKQGNKTAAEFTTEFRRYASLTEFNEQALLWAYKNNINPQIHDELMVRPDVPTTLVEYQELVIHLDMLFRERSGKRNKKDQNKVFNYGKPMLPYPHHPVSQPSKHVTHQTDYEAENDDVRPMEIDNVDKKIKRKQLSKAEKQRRIDLDLCRYCGSPDHEVADCDLTPPPSHKHSTNATQILKQYPPSKGNSSIFTYQDFQLTQSKSCNRRWLTLSSGKVSEETSTMEMSIGPHNEDIQFSLTKLGQYPLILGISWLKRHNPDIEWSNHTVIFGSELCHRQCLHVSCKVKSLSNHPKFTPKEGISLALFDQAPDNKFTNNFVNKNDLVNAYQKSPFSNNGNSKIDVKFVSYDTIRKDIYDNNFCYINAAEIIHIAEYPISQSIAAITNPNSELTATKEDYSNVPEKYKEFYEVFTTKNQRADALSRRPDFEPNEKEKQPIHSLFKPDQFALSATAISYSNISMDEELKKQILNHQKEDPIYNIVDNNDDNSYSKNTRERFKNYSIDEVSGLLLKNSVIYIPNNDAIKLKLLQIYHDNVAKHQDKLLKAPSCHSQSPTIHGNQLAWILL